MANIVDVAKRAGVSISTVSNVINGTKYVGEELTERVNRAIRELGYHSNEMASSMKRRVTNNIGVILPNISMIFFPEVLNGIEAAARENGYHLFYFSTDYDFEKEKEYLKLLKNSWVDGIVLDSCCAASEMEDYQKLLVENVSGRYVPVAALEAPFTHEAIGTVTFNEAEYTRQAVEYLIGLGRKKIGFLNGPRQLPVDGNTVRGCREALERYGLPFAEENILTGDYFAESGYRVVREALKNGADWDALLAANDQMAIGAMKALQEAGKAIPEDVAVMGVDGVFVSSLVEPSLTTVDLPKFSMGYQAVQLLLEMMKAPGTPGKKVQLEGKLTVRRSTEAESRDEWILTGW